jgi:hypothetical protein
VDGAEGGKGHHRVAYPVGGAHQDLAIGHLHTSVVGVRVIRFQMWGRMATWTVSIAQAGYQPAAGCQPAPRENHLASRVGGTLRICGLHFCWPWLVVRGGSG